ncbi:SulP family inorganic anion transporter [Paractinoplanes maris]|uniref:SulP family inorganic anion transporter n=1 Tax=Paractinoplanes maris TaxID=1734446 RepID=UPI00202172B0|nr:SulP family inorganic anion transporter [Actinoplanes maris]
MRLRFPSWRVARRDLLAGLPNAVASVPDGMAAGVLAGVSPVHGLYASAFGPIAGGLTTGTRLMMVTTTSAAALAAGNAVAGVAPADRPGALALLTLVAGLMMVAAGLLRLGRFTRFVAHSVMTGLLTGIAVTIVLGQVPALTGAEVDADTSIGSALAVLLHPGRVSLPALLVGLGALALMLAGALVRRPTLGALAALLVPTVVVALADLDVATVADSGDIPAGLPAPALPDFTAFSPSLLAGAAAVALIVLVQGVGVAESAPNADGSRPGADRDFLGQGAGNLLSALFRGQPVGGSVGQTALNVTAGARTRWAAVFAGGWMLVILALFAGLVGRVAQPTLAAILIFAAAGSLSPAKVGGVVRTGLIPRIAVVATFLATLFLPVAAAVGVGVVLSLILQLNRDALDLTIVELVPDGDHRLIERPAPAQPASDAVTLLDVYGSLLYAGARTLQARLPDPTGTRRPAVVLRMRGRVSLGATFFVVLADYAERLGRVDGRLYLSGVDPGLVDQLDRLSAGRVRVVPATAVVGESSRLAYHLAQSYLVRTR